MATAIYARVSSRKQTEASQLPDLKRLAKQFEDEGEEVVWFRDTFTGMTMERPGWRKLEEGMRSGRFTRIVIWRLDRLGRLASGMMMLLDELAKKNVNLVSIRDGIDLSTPAGRMFAGVLASMAQFETEVRGERTKSGQAVARAKGVHMGRPKGIRTPIKVNDEQRAAVKQLNRDGKSVSAISRTMTLARNTIYKIIAEDLGHA